VFWKESVESNVVGTSTNSNGYYDLILTSDDSVTIVYSMLGYETVEMRLLPNREVLNINVALKESDEQLAEIEVKGIQRQQDMMERVDASTRRVIPDLSGGGIESLLITFSGVSQTNEMSSQYNVRGGSFDENAVYVNGIEIHRPLLVRAGQQEGLSFVNPEMVDNVLFSAGGFDARFGDKASSVLDISYKRPMAFEASLTGGFQGGSIYVGVGDSMFSQLHGIRYKSSQYMLGSLQTKGNYRPHFLDYQTFMSWRLSKNNNWRIALLANYSLNSYGFTPDSMSSSFGTMQTARNLTIYYDGQEQDLFQTAFGALSVQGNISPNVMLNFDLSGFYTNERETYDIQGEYILSDHPMDGSQSSPSGSTGQTISSETAEGVTVLGKGTYHEHARNSLTAGVATVQHTGQWSTGQNKLRWGVSGQLERITDRINEWEWRDSAGYSLPHTEKSMELFYVLRSEASLLSGRVQGYIQDSYTWHTDRAKIILTGGARLHWWSYNNEVLVSPRASVVIMPGWKRDISFRIATGLYYQAPFYKELRDTLTDNYGITRIHLNDKLKAARTTQLVFGTDYYFRAMGRPFKLTAEAYAKYMDRGTSYTVDNVRVRYSGTNDVRGYTIGLDLKLYGELVPGADSWISFSTMRSREQLLTHPELGWLHAPQEQRYQFAMFFQDYLPQLPQLHAHLKFVWSEGLPYGAPRSITLRGAGRMPDYRRIDLGLTHVSNAHNYAYMKRAKHLKQWTIGFEVFNLVDWRNVNSYFWVSDVDGNQWASPNYLTGRRYNIKIAFDFQ
ncbi:MAG: TonB-dependent receptor, partial [Paludibacteraceae bacterium]|nr:TonB-dependent receptor [Paludibacteraceae bacterium]